MRRNARQAGRRGSEDGGDQTHLLEKLSLLYNISYGLLLYAARLVDVLERVHFLRSLVLDDADLFGAGKMK